MIVKRMSTREARANFSELLGSVYYTGQPVMVERKGKPVAVLITPSQFEQIGKIKADGWAVVDDLRKRNADQDTETVYQEVTKVVEGIRQGRYDQEKKAKKRSR